jgi:acetylornithine/succinyldiaminopimelate/putrescine aminotransferase
LENSAFLEHIRQMASLFEDGFAGLKDKHPDLLVEARQRGLMMGLKLADPNFGPMMTRIGFDAGLLVVYANNDPSALQILPPLIIQEDQVQQVLELLDGMFTVLGNAIA